MEFAGLLVELKQFDLVPLIVKRSERLKGYDYQETLFAAMGEIALADVAFEQGDFDTALYKYALSFADLAQQTGYASYLLTDKLRELEKRLHLLPNDTKLAWCDYLANLWETKHVSLSRPDMLRLIEEIRIDMLS